MSKLYIRPASWTASDFILAGVPRTEIDRRKARARYFPMNECITRYYTTAAEDEQYDRDSLELYEFSRDVQEWRRDMATGRR